ncbi:MAG: DUF1932 domain-containing protein [Chloroflexota bacterium]
MTKIGILHPGAMGISVAATIKNGGHTVYWASDGRSADTAKRAAEHGLQDAGSVAALCQSCEIIVSVCPPHAAEDVAREVVGHGFQGIYIDGNAISPMRAKQIDAIVTTAGATFVDGGIIGGPAWKRGTTWLYLSGEAAETAVSIFAAGPLETEVLGPEIGQASALKMCFAAYTKGTTALLSAILGAADNLGVWPALQEQWRRYEWELADSAPERVRRVTAKAWRFAGEMEEIAATLDAAGMPDGFHKAAGDVYRRTAHFKNASAVPELAEVLAALQS